MTLYNTPNKDFPNKINQPVYQKRLAEQEEYERLQGGIAMARPMSCQHIASGHFDGMDVIIKDVDGPAADYLIMFIDRAGQVQEYNVLSPDMFEFIAERIKADMVQKELDEQTQKRLNEGADMKSAATEGQGIG